MSLHTAPLEIVRAGPPSLRPVLRFCLARPHHGAADLERHVSAFLEYARAMSIDLNRIWIARRGTEDIAGAACIVSPGRSAMLLVSCPAMTGGDETAMRALAARAADDVFREDVAILQVLLDEYDDTGRRALEHGRFREIALLHYLERPTGAGTPPGIDADGANHSAHHWIHYSPETHAEFERTILDTYIDSADCPGLSNMRDIGDVIEGHKSAGRFDPRRWLLLATGAEPMACLLLAQNPLRPLLEIVYMGVRPAYRRRSIGREVLAHAIRIAQGEQCQALTLAVDARNEAGCRLYRSFGFRETTRRRAMILQNPASIG